MLDSILFNELYDNATVPINVLNNNDTTSANWYDTSPGVLWWLNASSAATGSWDVGTIGVTTTNLIGEKADYYNVSVYYTTQMMDSGQSAIVYNLGSHGYSDTISSRASVNSGGSIGYPGSYVSTGVLPTDYPGQWAEEARQTSTPAVQVCQTHLCTISNNASGNRPWTADEIDEMTVVIDMRIDTGMWPYLSNYNVMPVRFCLIQIQITAVPVTWYTAPAEGEPEPAIGPSALDYRDAGYLGYILPLMAILALSGLMAILNRNEGERISMSVFQVSFIIGLMVLIWASIFPVYSILLVFLVMGGMMFGARGEPNE
jgi:hypothetical protein